MQLPTFIVTTYISIKCHDAVIASDSTPPSSWLKCPNKVTTINKITNHCKQNNQQKINKIKRTI